MNMNIAFFCEKGPVRERNEDAVYVDAEWGVFVLADGMGGGVDGHKVSEYAATSFANLIKSSITPNLTPDISSALRQINTRIYQNYSTKGLTAGTTFSAVICRNHQAYIAHVGDSEIHLLRADTGDLETLTEKHTLEADLTKKGVGPRSAQRYRNVLTRAIGTTTSVSPQIGNTIIKHGDILLLASDGVTNCLGKDIEQGILNQQIGLTEKLSAIHQIVLSNNPTDNISCILIEQDN